MYDWCVRTRSWRRPQVFDLMDRKKCRSGKFILNSIKKIATILGF